MSISKTLISNAPKVLAGLLASTVLYEGYRWKSMDCDWTTAGYIIPRKVKPNYFKNRIVWITGASSGIGQALCYYLASLNVGVKLVLSARRENKLNDIKNDLVKHYKNEIYGTDIYVLPLDLSLNDIKYLETKYNSIKKYFSVSSIDILINNAGIAMLSKFVKFNALNSANMLQTNLFSPIILSKFVLNDIINNNKNQNKFGHICNVGSVVAYITPPYQSTYNVTKSGMLTFGISLEQELKQYENITITDVLPGPVATEIDLNSMLSNGRKANKKSQLLQKGMTSKRCAELICIAISNKLRESWPVKGNVLTAGYIAYYNPWFFGKFVRPAISKIMMKGLKPKPKSKL